MPEILHTTPFENLQVEQDWVLLSGQGWLNLPFPEGSTRAWLEISNFRGKNVETTIQHGENVVFQGAMPAGANRFLLQRHHGSNRLKLKAETWVPSEELGLADDRHFSLHLTGIVFD